MQNNDVAVIGLSVMGHSLALNLADHGFKVAGFNRTAAVTEKMVKKWPHENFMPYYSLSELVESLSRPRRIILMVQAGAPVDALIDQLTPFLNGGDIIMDCGNSFFRDTQLREKRLAEMGLCYFGIGVSGGEAGARNGPSIMPGGDRNAYQRYLQPMLEAIAAAAEGTPCCAYIGPDGAGHYVKMVHNGIEYADMQIIAESYLLLKQVGGMGNKAQAELFEKWNQGELHSYLIGITAGILREKDDFEAGELLDYIVDSAAQKGTGRWTSIEALRQGVDVSMINAAGGARLASNRLELRAQAAKLLPGPEPEQVHHPETFAEDVRRAMYAAKIIAYSQGFALMRNASKIYSWDLDFASIASIFRAGCIIRAAFLDDITREYKNDPELHELMLHGTLLERVNKNRGSLRSVVSSGIINGVPLPAMSAAISYLDVTRGAALGANLIQAQRDCFGAHTYNRTDQAGTFHHEWSFEE